MGADYYLGVDGGGTKTVFVLVDGTGKIVAEHRDGSSYHLQTGFVGLQKIFREGTDAVTAMVGIKPEDIAYAFFGIPAYGEDEKFDPLIDRIPQMILKHKRYTCANDMVCGWAAAFGGDDGINIVAGTGSIGYGQRKGASARAGGWGEVFSDEGSAYWIAAEALKIFSRMSDGRQAKGPLYDVFRSHFQVQDDLHICGKIMKFGASCRDQIAQLSNLVRSAAEAGDQSAIRLFQQAAKELLEIVDAIRMRLGFEAGETVPVSYSGGVFKAGELIQKPFQQLMQSHRANFELITPKHSPCYGAALYARSLGSNCAALDQR